MGNGDFGGSRSRRTATTGLRNGSVGRYSVKWAITLRIWAAPTERLEVCGTLAVHVEEKGVGKKGNLDCSYGGSVWKALGKIATLERPRPDLIFSNSEFQYCGL